MEMSCRLTLEIKLFAETILRMFYELPKMDIG